MGYLADRWKREADERKNPLIRTEVLAKRAELWAADIIAQEPGLDAALEFRAGGQIFTVYEDVPDGTKTTTRRVLMSLSPQGIEIGMAFEYLPGTLIPWEEVSEVLIDGPDALSKRVTVGRAVAFGVLALAMQKSDSRVYIVIETTDGDTQICYSKDATAPDVRTWFRPYQGNLSKSPQPASRITDAPARMKSLQAMLADGLITREEFDGKRQAILDAL